MSHGVTYKYIVVFFLSAYKFVLFLSRNLARANCAFGLVTGSLLQLLGGLLRVRKRSRRLRFAAEYMSLNCSNCPKSHEEPAVHHLIRSHFPSGRVTGLPVCPLFGVPMNSASVKLRQRWTPDTSKKTEVTSLSLEIWQ